MTETVLTNAQLVLPDRVVPGTVVLRGGAIAMGASVEITTVPGYLPMTQDANLVGLFRHNAGTLVGAEEVL